MIAKQCSNWPDNGYGKRKGDGTSCTLLKGMPEVEMI